MACSTYPSFYSLGCTGRRRRRRTPRNVTGRYVRRGQTSAWILNRFCSIAPRTGQDRASQVGPRSSCQDPRRARGRSGEAQGRGRRYAPCPRIPLVSAHRRVYAHSQGRGARGEEAGGRREGQAHITTVRSCGNICSRYDPPCCISCDADQCCITMCSLRLLLRPSLWNGACCGDARASSHQPVGPRSKCHS